MVEILMDLNWKWGSEMIGHYKKSEFRALPPPCNEEVSWPEKKENSTMKCRFSSCNPLFCSQGCQGILERPQKVIEQRLRLIAKAVQTRERGVFLHFPKVFLSHSKRFSL